MNHSHGKKIVGIMVCETNTGPPLAQQSFFAQLCALGAKYNLLVYVFSPQHIHLNSATIQGYTYHPENENHWASQELPLPDLIYDRSFFENRTQYIKHRAAIRALLTIKKIPYLGRCLKGKWEVHKVLQTDALIAPHLPQTELLSNLSTLIRRLNDDGDVVIKPEFGTHGKGILVVTKTENSDYFVQGRNNLNHCIRKKISDPIALCRWISLFIGSRNYLIQKYLPLLTKRGEAFDIRVLLQKNQHGDWTLTGMAVRLGQPLSITSNLHGGGTSHPLSPFLEQQFDPDQAEMIKVKAIQLAESIPRLLEQHFGRLAELGLDLGVDTAGQIWVIEVNSKPGRAVARCFSQPMAYQHAIHNPIHYARYLLH
ncbi:MAG: hypothetical protein JWM44_3976 [Bacilli bacterium]|nr:hypothetical protein [Bacilli bacterium]